jgi:uncharacterized LabA/DUF88 family protein
MNAYLYVDGENHYCGVRDAWKAKTGQEHPESIDAAQLGVTNLTLFFGNRIRVRRKSRFFWDTYSAVRADPGRSIDLKRAVYFTTFTGTAAEIHEEEKEIRKAGFEPCLINEEKDKAKQRDNMLEKGGVLIKGKGVDIALATRMLEDCFMNNYSTCFLFTSDVDYLPVIKAVRRLGKHVIVCGFRRCLGKHSPLETVPDSFVDCEGSIMKDYKIKDEGGG